jgi:small conductance mechanosensitive channel
VVIPNRRIVGEILHNYGTIRQLQLKVGVAYGANLDADFSRLSNIVSAFPDARLRELQPWTNPFRRRTR